MIGFPFNSMYAASKFALAGFSESLGKEVARFGVKVTAVEPGGFRTNFGPAGRCHAGPLLPEYRAATETMKARMEWFRGAAANDPRKGAEVILALVDLHEPPAHLALGEDGNRMVTEALKARLAEYEAFREMSSATAYEG